MSEGRYELKYAVPLADRARVLHAAAGHISQDHHGEDLSDWIDVGHGETPPLGYRVHSLYLDSPSLEGYERRLSSNRVRDRVRVRTYGAIGDPAPVFLEAKRKLDDRVIKHRVRVGDACQWAQADAEAPWRSIIAPMLGPPGARARRWQSIVEAGCMVPVCTIHYAREVYIAGTARLTLDHEVRSVGRPDPRQLQGNDGVQLIPTRWMILELKFFGLPPAWMRTLVRLLDLRAEPVSKFGLGVACSLRGHHPAEIRAMTPHSILQDLDVACVPAIGSVA